MTLPLYSAATQQPPRRSANGHAGLWYDKFCDQWDDSWRMSGEQKLKWIKTVAGGQVGTQDQIDESALRLMRLVKTRGGRCEVFTTESRFVTGLGRSHPVENGFVWHPTLGTPFLPGSSVKGMVKTWAKLDVYPRPYPEMQARLLGEAGRAGAVCFLDAVPVAPVRIEADVMTPHYADWDDENPPGDWLSPNPIPFLTTAMGATFLFGLIPGLYVTGGDLDTVLEWLRSALAWAGAGAKTAVGYGRFARVDRMTDDLRHRLHNRERQRKTRTREERKAREREKRRALLSPIEREIEEILDGRRDKNMPEITAIMQEVRSGRWAGAARVEVARWLEIRMRREQRWKERSRAKNPVRDRDHQRTLLIKRWLDGE